MSRVTPAGLHFYDEGMNWGSVADWAVAVGTIAASTTAIVLAYKGGLAKTHDLADQLRARVVRKDPLITSSTFKVEYTSISSLVFYDLIIHYKASDDVRQSPPKWHSEKVADTVLQSQLLTTSTKSRYIVRNAPVFISFEDSNGRDYIRNVSTGKYVTRKRFARIKARF